MNVDAAKRAGINVSPLATPARGLVESTAMTDVPTPVVFGPSDGALFGFYHAPSGGAARRSTGLVLCNPLGYDAMCTHRTYRVLAERAAASGFPTIRFDYDGTGDSAGRTDGPKRVRAWLDSIGFAIEELRARSGLRDVTLFGTRFGATLAAACAQERADVRGLVLWGPSITGRAYVRELRAFRLIKAKEAPKPRADGDEEAAGYLFDRATVADMSAIDLAANAARIAERVFLLPRETPGGEERLARHFETGGAQVTRAATSGYGMMMRDPQETIVPTDTLVAILDWLVAGEGDDRGARDVAPIPVAAPLATPAFSAVASTGPIVREEVLAFGDGDRLIGFFSAPAERPALPDAPAMLFLNVGANHRVGPNRMYVSMGRAFASLGYYGFRFDVAGLGDSRVKAGASENRLYSKDSVVDVKAAMDFLEATRGVRRFVLVGLCSGAYLAFHTAVEDPRVVGQVLLNPQTFEWKEGDSLELSMRKSFLSTRYYARALLAPAMWKRLLRGRVDVGGVVGILRERMVAHAKSRVDGLRARLAGETEPRSDVERAFVRLSDRGMSSLLVFSFDDGGLDMIEQHLGRNVRSMAKRKNFHFEIVEGADHTFTPVDSQHALQKIVTRFVVACFP